MYRIFTDIYLQCNHICIQGPRGAWIYMLVLQYIHTNIFTTNSYVYIHIHHVFIHIHDLAVDVLAERKSIAMGQW